MGIDLSIQTGLDLQSSPQQATTIFVLNKCHLALSSLNAIFIKYCFSPKSSIARTIFQHITSDVKGNVMNGEGWRNWIKWECHRFSSLFSGFRACAEDTVDCDDMHYAEVWLTVTFLVLCGVGLFGVIGTLWLCHVCVQDEVWMGCKCCYEVFKDLLFIHNQVMLLCLLIVD